MNELTRLWAARVKTLQETRLVAGRLLPFTNVPPLVKVVKVRLHHATGMAPPSAPSVLHVPNYTANLQ